MENNENLVADMAAENTEAITAEESVAESPKLYTEAEMNAYANEVSGKRTARRETKIRKEYERQYGGILDTLRAGMGKENASVEELNEELTQFYVERGKIKKDAVISKNYSAEDVATLARADAEDIISGGFEEVAEEVERLNKKGFDRMTQREKATLKILADHKANAERGSELASIGVTAEEYNSKEFRDFSKMFNASTPIKDVYDIYKKSQPKKEIKTAGSMKNTASEDGIKDFYTPEEAKRFTVEDFNRNPALLARVEASMKKWR